jgi:hypothetical protein
MTFISIIEVLKHLNILTSSKPYPSTYKVCLTLSLDYTAVIKYEVMSLKAMANSYYIKYIPENNAPIPEMTAKSLC